MRLAALLGSAVAFASKRAAEPIPDHAGRADIHRAPAATAVPIMRGMNAGGRIYGYIGLRLLARNDATDDATFDRLTALDVDVDACNGCRTTKAKAATIDLARFRR